MRSFAITLALELLWPVRPLRRLLRNLRNPRRRPWSCPTRCIRDRRRPRSWETRVCGMCRRARCCRQAVVGERLPGELRRQPGFTDVSNWPVTFGYGLRTGRRSSGRSWCDRIDRDIRPLFITDRAGRRRGAADPLARRRWSGNHLGDFWVGAKLNLVSQWRQKPAALARARHGEAADGRQRRAARAPARRTSRFDAIVSKEMNERVECPVRRLHRAAASPTRSRRPTASAGVLGAGLPACKRCGSPRS